MKKFFDGGEYFVLSAFIINAVPAVYDSEASAELAETICEDACYLSASGRGQTAIEILRIAGDCPGSPIRHILSVRTHDSSEQECVIRQEALVKGVASMLHLNGYVFEEIRYEEYRKQLSDRNTQASWALIKDCPPEHGVRGVYRSPRIVKDVDWKRIYAALDGSGCCLTVQIIPSMLTDAELRSVKEHTAECSQAVDGVMPGMRDSLAASPAERWKVYSQESSRPFAAVNIIITGPVSDAALVTARVRQSIGGAAFQVVSVSDHHKCSIYNQPWKTALAVRKVNDLCIEKWASAEIAQLFQLPSMNGYFVGAEQNPFSLLPETELLSSQLSGSNIRGLRLGESVYYSKYVALPFEQLLLHTAVMGRSGAGKTTLLKRMVASLHAHGIPVLILEPVKREYRDMIYGMSNSRIYTVENPVTPLLINPFFVPKGIALREYKSSLLSAFKAAFSLPDPLPSLFEKAISETYTLNNWTDSSMSTDSDVNIFDMADFIRIFKQIIERSEYSKEVKGNIMSGGSFRLQSLIERCRRTFDTVNSTSVTDLLNGCSVIEMGSLEPEQKSLVSALTLIRILAYLKAVRKSDGQLRNIILIDEAHALLDQGEGATEEEKALNSTMTQLMINVITEVRAYGVGVIFSDQSPSRIGSRLLDNVDNILSFRLSGEEAEMLKTHIGAEDTLCKVLPIMSAGEFVLKNRFLSSPLAVKADRDTSAENCDHITDEQIARSQQDYLNEHAADCRPYAFCEIVGCKKCRSRVRDDAVKYSSQLYAEHHKDLRSPDAAAGYIMSIPKVFSDLSTIGNIDVFRRLCGCVAVHFLRKIAAEENIVYSKSAASLILTNMLERVKK